MENGEQNVLIKQKCEIGNSEVKIGSKYKTKLFTEKNNESKMESAK